MRICVRCGVNEVAETVHYHICHECRIAMLKKSWDTRRGKPQPLTKVCTRCRVDKPISEYYVTNGHPYPACAECCRKRRKTPATRIREKERFTATKLEVLGHYGKNGKPVCVVCGENRVLCLTIDHIKGGGMKHRKLVTGGSGGSRFYYWLKRNSYPEGYQTLCMNDNFLKLMLYENNSRHKAQKETPDV